MGPLEELRTRLPDADETTRQELDIIHRNGLRLGKLVNTLLDFSRIEAGRMQARYEPVDLAAFTADLASVFRSAVERAGLAYQVDCPALPHPVYADQEMWEKVVFNLLSNALKFTFEGSISVSLRPDGDQAVLRIADTGLGVAADEKPRLFERFHRIPTRGRGRTRAAASGWRWCGNWLACTAARSPRRAPRDPGPSSPSGCRSAATTCPPVM
jgi:signal transduction histidine kinase